MTGTLPPLLILILAHLIGDFILQKSTWQTERYANHFASKFLYLHAAIHGSLILLGLLLFFPLSSMICAYAAAVGISHFAIDAARSYTTRDKATWMLADQFLHFTVIAIIWLDLTHQWSSLSPAAARLLDAKVLLMITAYVVVVWPLSVLVGLICKRWAKDIDNLASLPSGGARIGQLERLLILTFVLADQFAAIGFLLAAKSVLRFGGIHEANHRKINEYVLLGTMVSFSSTIVFGLTVKRLISMV